ncbi:MAG: hypothetical protein AAB600_04230 [Patescibacteria group bacterium]
MEERFFNLNEEHIFAAERKRTRGFVKEAADDMRPAIDFPINRFNDLTDEEKKMEMMATRIYVVANTSEANRGWKASTVAHHLEQAKEAIETIYRNSQVQVAAHELNEDTRGNPYEYHTEMARDEIRYTLVLAALTGNTALLDAAIERMDSIITNAGEPTAKTLAVFEKARMGHGSSPTQDTFKTLKESYNEARQASAEEKRWERVATISSWYAIDVAKRGHFIEAIKGVGGFTKAAINDNSTATILPRQIIREVTGHMRHWAWHRTAPKGTDYSDLKLP